MTIEVFVGYRIYFKDFYNIKNEKNFSSHCGFDD